MSKNLSSKAIVNSRNSAILFAALGDKTRLQLVSRLCDDGPMSITKLSAGAKITRQAVTKHLRVLEDAGLASSSRLGREQLWQLEIEPLEQARYSLDRISRRWDEALGRLKALVERD